MYLLLQNGLGRKVALLPVVLCLGRPMPEGYEYSPGDSFANRARRFRMTSRISRLIQLLDSFVQHTLMVYFLDFRGFVAKVSLIKLSGVP